MVSQISVVINTLNESQNIKRVIESLDWASEIVVVDGGSSDGTSEILQKLRNSNKKLKIFKYQSVGYVEPARNFAISKATKEWILILDADESLPESLVERLLEIVSKMKQISYVRLPRKNIIFGHFMKASMWWPDYNIRFFRKSKVEWTDKIHKVPEAAGEGVDLPADEKWAIIHNHYNSLLQFLERMIRYTKIQAEELVKEGYKFDWKDLIKKPLGEFLSRFFANRGFEDGLHGLALSLLQAFSFMLVYLRVWEIEGFKAQSMVFSELKELSNQSGAEIKYWFKYANLSKNTFKRFFQKLKNKL